MTDKLKVLDLFSGIGGFSLGLERTGGFETVAFCEYDKKARLVLNKHWPEVPIYNDVRTLEYDGSVDIICGGYPCQPFSLAGQRKGEEDDRHLWPFMFSLIKTHRPTWIIGENVAGHISMGLDSVLADLEGEGYGTRVFVIPACAVDAKHRRDRLWIVANTSSTRGSRGPINQVNRCSRNNRGTHSQISRRREDKTLADADCKHVQGQQSSVFDPQERAGPDQRQIGSQDASNGGFWLPEPGMDRVAHGVPRRMDRLKQLGNAVVPQVVERIGNAILEAERTT